MDNGEHKDFGRTALPLLHPDLDASTSSQKLLVVVTLAALVIAGSTLAYRTHSYPFSTFAPAAGKQEDDPSGTGKDQVQGKRLSNGSVDAPGEGSLNGEEGDDNPSQAEGNREGKEKESKSSRKKDRRKRGKDPLKEILKGKPKGKALEQLLESGLQTPTAPPNSLLKVDKSMNNSSTNPTQILSNGSTSVPDTNPEKVSTQLADVSQKPHRTTAAFSPSTQSSTPLLLSTANHNTSQRRAGSFETRQSGAQANGDLSPPPALSDASIPASSSHREALTTAYRDDANGDGDRNNTRFAPKHDQALGAAASGLASNIVVPSPSTAPPLETEGDSAGETETSAGMSMNSSIIFSESGAVHTHGAEEAQITPVTSPASSEKSGHTPKVSTDAAKAGLTAPEPKPQKPSKNLALVDPWNWDDVSTGVALPVASTSSEADKAASNTSSRVSIPESPVTLAYTSFSSAVLSNKGNGLPPSTSLNPLSNSNESGSKMSESTSAPAVISTRKNVPSSESPSTNPVEGDHQGTSKDKEDEETTFTFPTLNPTSSTASAGSGPSRIRPSLGDIQSSPSTGRASPSIGAKRRPPTPSRNNSHSHSRNANSTGTPPPQRPMTPNSASTPGSESPTPSQAKPTLSIQTQLASMRGALEASRLREEKNKADIEQYVKEIETMKWENANWRRTEIELQAQIRNLMHQLQIYMSVFAGNAHLQQQYAANNTGAGHTGLINNPSLSSLYSTNSAATSSSTTSTLQQPSTTSDHTADNAPPAPSQSSQQAGPLSSQVTNPTSVPQHPAPQPLSLHMLHMNGMTSPTAILTPSGPLSPGYPLGSYSGPPQPFFPYAIPPHLQPTSPQVAMAYAQHMHMQQFQHQASIAQAHAQAQAVPLPHQASLFSAIFPPSQHGAASHFGSTPSSAAGTSSVGSQSPDRSGSPIPGPSLSRRKSRTRMPTAGSRMGGHSTWEEVGDGWVGASSSQYVGNDGEAPSSAPELSDDDASEEGFNEVLADAIFKRPESIRVRSSSRSLRSAFEADKSSKGGSTGTSPIAQGTEETEQFTEFAFPSLSDMGNIIYQSSVKSTNSAYSSGTSTSTSSSLSLSPAVDTSDVALEMPEETPAPNDTEEERPHSLPPVMEQPEDGEGLPEADIVKQALLQNDEVTSTQDPDPNITPRVEHPLRPQSSTIDGLADPSATGEEMKSENVPTPASADQQ